MIFKDAIEISAAVGARPYRRVISPRSHCIWGK